jgi:DNA-binding Lrp family transcriptional regulator
MTNKQKKTSQAEGLSSALRPPKQRDKNITSLLDRFADDDASLSPVDNLSPNANPSPSVNLSLADKLSPAEPLGYQKGNLAPGGNLARADSLIDLWSSIPVVKGHTRFWHMIIDHLYQHLDSFEQAVYTQLYRLSWGYGKETCNISNGRLAERANLKLTVTRRAIRDLQSKGLIQKIGYTWGKNHEQGIEYRLPLPDNLSRAAKQSPEDNLSPGAPIKEINTQKEITQTQVGVSVRSRFSLEECRRYADHLKQTGQGITNPGGYATKVLRSGEADAFIEAFLTPQSTLDINQCPDCRGSNFIYIDPTNHDKGVRPCKHVGLKVDAG